MNVIDYDNPIELMIDIIRDQSKKRILLLLERTKKQGYEICQELKDLKSEIVNMEVAQLVEMGLLKRKIHVRKQPYGVEYVLTNQGAMVVRSILSLEEIGIYVMEQYHMEDVLIKQGYRNKPQQ